MKVKGKEDGENSGAEESRKVKKSSKKLVTIVMAAMIVSLGMAVLISGAAAGVVTNFTITPSYGIANATSAYNATVNTTGFTTLNITIPAGFGVANNTMEANALIAEINVYNATGTHGNITIKANSSEPGKKVDLTAMVGSDDPLSGTVEVNYTVGAIKSVSKTYNSYSASVNLTLPTNLTNGSLNITVPAGLNITNCSVSIGQFVRNPGVGGYHNFTAKADGESTGEVAVFFVDKTKPTVTINSPEPGYYNESFEVNATVTDPAPSSGIKEVKCRWENTTEGDWVVMSRVASTTYWNFTTLDDIALVDGNYTVNVTAWDNASNANSSTVMNVSIDQTKPIFAIGVEINYTTHIANLTVNVPEQWLSGEPNVSVTNGSAVTVNTIDWDSTDLTWKGNYSIITTGTSNYTITANGTDRAGNYGEGVAYSNVTYVTFNASEPMEIPATPPNTSINITLDVTVADACITVTETKDNPTNVPQPETAVAFISIDADPAKINESVSVNMTIKIYYNRTEILSRGITEDSLAIYYLNGTVWERLPSTVNKTGEYVVATVNHLSDFVAMEDTTPPASVTNLNELEEVGQTWIKWTWTNPTDVDFNYTMIYLDGSWTNTNTSDESYTAEGLTSDTSYEIGTRTVDTAGNINQTWKNDTATTAATAAPAAPGGGGGGGGAPVTVMNVPIDPTTGAVTSTTKLTTEKATLTIPEGTIVKDAEGNPLSTSITTLHSPTTAETVGAIKAYDFGPSGTTFAPSIDLVISYGPADIPAGFSESDLVIRMYDGTAKAWIDLDTTVDTVAHTATAKVSHFSIFALFAAAAAPPAVVTPTVVPTAKPTITPPPVVPPVKQPWGLIIGIIIAVIIVGAAAYYFYTKKKT